MNMKLECMLKIIETKARWGESVDIVAERLVVVYFFYSDELSTFFYHN